MDIPKAKRILEQAINEGVLSGEEVDAVTSFFDYVETLCHKMLPELASCYCSECIYAIHHFESFSPYEYSPEYLSCGLLGNQDARLPSKDGFCSFGKSRKEYEESMKLFNKPEIKKCCDTCEHFCVDHDAWGSRFPTCRKHFKDLQLEDTSTHYCVDYKHKQNNE